MHRLMKVKSELVQTINNKKYDVCDEEQLEYLIQYVDWLLLHKLDLTSQNIRSLMEEIVTVSVHQLNLDLLNLLDTLCDMEKELADAKV